MISYGLYLWHWPVYLTLTGTRTGLAGNALLFARIAVTFAFATASYYLVERPIRRGTFHLPTPVFTAPAVAAALVAGARARDGRPGSGARPARLCARSARERTAASARRDRRVVVVAGGGCGCGSGPRHWCAVWQHRQLRCRRRSC